MMRAPLNRMMRAGSGYLDKGARARVEKRKAKPEPKKKPAHVRPK